MNTITKEIKVIEPTIEEAIKWLENEYPKGVELCYIDYRDSIENAKDREAILQNPDEAWDIIEGNTGWIADNEYQSIDYIINEYRTSLGCASGDIEISDEVNEAMSEWLQNHNTSDPVKDLLKNTGSEYMYYDTGISFESLDYANDQEKEITKRAKTIAKKLKIDYAKHEKDLRLMCSQAWYGGQVVILFENKIENFIHEAKYIKFNKNAEICIMDRGNGSGDSCGLQESILFQFQRENLHSDEGDNGYSYSSDVCGLVSNIMNDGVLTNKKEKNEKVIRVKTNEDRKAQRERENRYITNWKNGKCTFGDMNIKRHKSAPYRNEYPCGNKCETCGTFWID